MSEIEQENQLSEVVTPYTVKQSTTHVPLGKPTPATRLAGVADSIEDDESEEQEWDSIVNKPHVRQALRRMAAEARRQYYAGQTEEGGFAVE